MPQSDLLRVKPKPRRPRSPRRTAAAPASLPGTPDLRVVAIGASAGGLDACRKLLDALPPANDMAFILVQHLDPSHESMMVDLLAGHTAMTVCQAADGMPLEPDHLYVIPPGRYLAVRQGTLYVTRPQTRHGARLPFDFLLNSLAQDCGPRTVCVVLSGTGADGSLGLQAVKQSGGHVIVQDPGDAGYDGMPRSAIATGLVDLVLPVTGIPGALVESQHKPAIAPAADKTGMKSGVQGILPEIIELLRTRTAYDFTLYKAGTLERRIERRMALTPIERNNADRYLELLRRDPGELRHLAKDLLINVTSFFRDPKVFELLEQQIVPDLVRTHPPGQAIRIWIVGCSTGEEAYSLAMIFREQIAAARVDLKLQLFASDVDPDAIASAREGLYPTSIEADVSPERLARFFLKDEHGYRVTPELRGAVVFTVQDVLTDPPFARLDMVSCRNLLIYLGSAAQTKVASVFHFALRRHGLLLLGTSETISNADGRFEVVSKAERLYRRTGRSRAADFSMSRIAGDDGRAIPRTGQGQVSLRQPAFGELCRRLVIETFAPAVVLINRKLECLYSLGPTDRYLRVPPGLPTHDLLATVRPTMRTKLRAAIERAVHSNDCIVVPGGRTDRNAGWVPFNIDVRPVAGEGDGLLLVSFIETPRHEIQRASSAPSAGAARVAELEQELEAMRVELQGAIRNLEVSGEEQTAINEEALSVNEEYQSTNEELLTSKEELQSLNEELTALNGQLQETLERQRTTSNDLQNVLYSTDVATLFLDRNLNIRFFTPATKSLFNVIPSDIGRPLADLNSLAVDVALLSDATTVLSSSVPIEREIEARNGTWYIRRVLPYRTQEGGVEGVVITFADITERRHTTEALEAAKKQAEQATSAKSRFLAAASHDLRQPLQTLALLQGLLARNVEGEKMKKLVERFDETLGAVAGMLNTLLDINQIEAGTVHVELADFPVQELLGRLASEFTYHAQAKELALHVVPCSLSIRSDPRLLEQMVRNLISNALKYTRRGKVLVGCRRHRESLTIEVWDTGIGIPDEELSAIFEEYHQLDNAARERSRGLGLGLSIVSRLGTLLNQQVKVQSWPGKGSMFSIEVSRPATDSTRPAVPVHHVAEEEAQAGVRAKGTILVIEDDPQVCTLLDLFLRDEGHRCITARDGPTALELIARGTIKPDIILADYNLPNGMDGLELIARIRDGLHRKIPAVILTGDISTRTSNDAAARNCVRLTKPVKLPELSQTLQRLLPPPVRHGSPAVPDEAPTGPRQPVIYVVDDDSHIRAAVRAVLEEDGRLVEDYADCEAFLAAYRPGREACLVLDAYLPGMNGLDLLRRLQDMGDRVPVVIITGDSDVQIAVQAMKAGASDFIEKPIRRSELLGSIERALEQSRDAGKLAAWHAEAAGHIARLTGRQRQIMDLVLAGQPSKNIAADLGISQRTVENHRASIMKRTGSKSVPALARLALAATSDVVQNPIVSGES